MEFIPESLFDTFVGKEFVVRDIYLPQYKEIAKSMGFKEEIHHPQPENDYTYTKVMVCGGTITAKMSYDETYFNEEIDDLDVKTEEVEMELESDGSILINYKKDVHKLNEKLTNLKDCLTSIITSTISYAAAVIIPFSAAAGTAGIMSTIGQLKNLKSIISEVRELQDKLSLNGENLNRLAPGAGSLIDGVLDLIESVTNTLTTIIPA